MLAVVLSFSGMTPVQAQVNPCRLLGKAEVRAAVGAMVTEVSPGLAEGGAPNCDFSVERGGVTLTVLDRQTLEGRSLQAWLDDADSKLPFRAVPGLGEEAFIASASAEVVEGKPETSTSTAFLFARQGAQLLNITVIVTGKGPSDTAVVKLARRALLRLTPEH